MKKKSVKNNAGKAFFEILEMMDKPGEFFRRDLSIFRGILYFILADAIFTVMVQTMVLYGIIPATLKTTFIMSIIINFFSIIAGFSIISAIMIMLNIFMGGKNPSKLFNILTYSMIPALFLSWIPFIFVQFITIFWSMATMFLGVKTVEKFEYKKAIAYPALFIILVVALTIISQNYIFLGFLK